MMDSGEWRDGRSTWFGSGSGGADIDRLPTGYSYSHLHPGDGWGNGWDGDDDGNGETPLDLTPFAVVRSDPTPDDLRQLVTNTIAFAHLWRMG